MGIAVVPKGWATAVLSVCCLMRAACVHITIEGRGCASNPRRVSGGELVVEDLVQGFVCVQHG